VLKLGGQTPHDLGRAFEMYTRYKETGSMIPRSNTV
jgi:succinyl-CoA:acetate CoA-transferase